MYLDNTANAILYPAESQNYPRPSSVEMTRLQSPVAWEVFMQKHSGNK